VTKHQTRAPTPPRALISTVRRRVTSVLFPRQLSVAFESFSLPYCFFISSLEEFVLAGS
jgi:hypothetical protein